MSNQSSKIDVKSILNITLRLFIVCTIIAAVVAGVNALTAEKISANEQKEINDTIAKVFTEGKIEKISEGDSESSVSAIYGIKDSSEGSTVGYSVICAPKGFGGEIKMMVAFDYEKNIKAIRIMSHSETPGIGDKVQKDESFAAQFEGRSQEMTYGVDGIDKISGSSKSSGAVLNGVNDAIAALAAIK